MAERNIHRIMEEEMMKLRNYPRWRTMDVIPIERSDLVAEKMALFRQSGARVRKLPVQRGNVQVAWKIQIQE